MRQAAAITLRSVPKAFTALPPRLRRRLVAALAAALVLAGAYVGWFRDSSLVAVDHVTVTGLTTRDADRVRAALAEAAGDMTTLHVRRGELEEAVEGYRVVSSLEVAPDFPHSLSIRVVEHRPAALVGRGSERVPVAADGTVLSGLPVERSLPVLEAAGGAPGGRLTDARALRALRVIGAAPAVLGRRVLRVEESAKRGFVVRLRRGPELVFGDLTRLGAKWTAATRVLADPAAKGATYIDVRIPERPAAGGLAEETIEPVAPAGGQTAPEGQAIAPQEAAAPQGEVAPQAAAPAAPTTPAPTRQQPQAQSPATPAPTPGGGVQANPQP